MDYAWPGNVRELENVIRRVVVFSDETPILKEFALMSKKKRKGHFQDSTFPDPKASQGSLKYTKRMMFRAEREVILETLKQMKWNKKKTAEKLGISYKTLLYKLKKIEKEGS